LTGESNVGLACVSARQSQDPRSTIECSNLTA
jgi:hypothetical protein